MRLRTVAKLGMVLSVVLFCTAVGFYGFAKLSMVDKGKDVNLFSLVPAEGCIGVLESDNIDYFLNEFPQLNYNKELSRLQFSELFNYVLTGLAEYTEKTAHGLNSKMNRMVVSFHEPGSPRDQVAYFYTGDKDEKAFEEMLLRYVSKDFLPKKEKYRGKSIHIYPLDNNDFLAVYSEGGFLMMSYQKRLIEQVIDAKEDEKKALCHEEVFAPILRKKKSHNFLTLYGRTLSIPLLQDNVDCWSEFDFHMNSDVVYLTGDTFMPDTYNGGTQMAEKLKTVPNVCEDSLILSADKDAMAIYMDRASENPNQTLFNGCVANLSRESAFMMVTDMDKVSREPERFVSYLPGFLLDNASLFRSFILSVQLSQVNNRLSHILVLTYKD